MAKISNTTAYPNITPQGSDYLVLTDSSDNNATKTVTVQALAEFIDDQVTLQEVLNSGNTADSAGGNTGTIILQDATSTTTITLAGNNGGITTTGSVVIGGRLNVTDISTLPTVNIDGGNIDGTRIGQSLASDGKFTSVSGSSAVLTSGVRNANPNNAAAALRVTVGPMQFGNTGGQGFGDVGDVLKSNGSDGTPEWLSQSELEPNQVLKDVRNQTGGPLVKGTAVHLDPNPSGNPLVVAADNGNNLLMPASGLVYEDIANGQDGKIILVGLLEAVSVSISGTPAVGDVVYVGSTGGLTVDRPVAFDEQVQNVGIISRTAGQTDIQVTCTGRTNDLPNLRAKQIFIGSNAAGEVGKAVESNLIEVDNNNPSLPDYDVTIGVGNASTALIRGKYRINATHPYGEDNVALGELSLDSLDPTNPGTDNVGIGVSALENLTIGGSNVAIGVNALTTSTQGSDNIAIGVNAAGNSVDSIRNVAIGTNALRNVTGNSNNQNVSIGWNNSDALTAGQANVILGAAALGNQVSSSSTNVILGGGAAGSANVVAGFNQATLVGFEAGWGSTVDRATAVGYQAGRVNGGASNTYIGRQAGLVNTVNGNTFVGAEAGVASLTGAFNTIMGATAAGSMTVGGSNTIVGERGAQTLVNGSSNVIVGKGANVNDPAASESTIIGTSAIGPESATVIGNGANANNPEQVIIGSGATGGGVAAPFIAFSDGMGSSYGSNTALLQFPDNAAAIAGGLPVGSIYVIGPTGGAVSNPAALAIVTS